jgi:putative endonuclease
MRCDAMPDARTYFVYILASRPRGTLYIGVTNDLARRLAEHRDGNGGTFTKRYKVNQLMWFEAFGEITVAIRREKSLKLWPRLWKVNLLERDNPHGQDLSSAFGAS